MASSANDFTIKMKDLCKKLGKVTVDRTGLNDYMVGSHPARGGAMNGSSAVSVIDLTGDEDNSTGDMPAAAEPSTAPVAALQKKRKSSDSTSDSEYDHLGGLAAITRDKKGKGKSLIRSPNARAGVKRTFGKKKGGYDDDFVVDEDAPLEYED